MDVTIENDDGARTLSGVAKFTRIGDDTYRIYYENPASVASQLTADAETVEGSVVTVNE